jgi:hypothetical protein
MNITLNADTVSKFLTALLAGVGAMQYFDLVNFLTLVSPETAGGILSIYAVVKLVFNAWTAATTVKVPVASTAADK